MSSYLKTLCPLGQTSARDLIQVCEAAMSKAG